MRTRPSYAVGPTYYGNNYGYRTGVMASASRTKAMAPDAV